MLETGSVNHRRTRIINSVHKTYILPKHLEVSSRRVDRDRES